MQWHRRLRVPASRSWGNSAAARNPQLSVAACPRIQLDLLDQRLGLNAGAFAISGTPHPLRQPENGTQFTWIGVIMAILLRLFGRSGGERRAHEEVLHCQQAR